MTKVPTGYSATNFTCTVAYMASASNGKFAEETAERTIIMEI